MMGHVLMRSPFEKCQADAQKNTGINCTIKNLHFLAKSLQRRGSIFEKKSREPIEVRIFRANRNNVDAVMP